LHRLRIRGDPRLDGVVEIIGIVRVADSGRLGPPDSEFELGGRRGRLGRLRGVVIKAQLLP